MNPLLECGLFLFLKEIPPDLVCDINRDCANTFIKSLLEKQKWPEVLLLLTRKVSGEPPLGDGLIKECDLSALDLCAIIPQLSTWDQRRTQLLGCLIDGGGEIAWMIRTGEWSNGSPGYHLSQGLHLIVENPLNPASFSASTSSHFETVMGLMPRQWVLPCRNSAFS